MSPFASLRMIVESPAAFLGPRSPWTKAPVLLTRGASSVDLCNATTAAEAFGQGREDALEATVRFLCSAGFLEPQVMAVSLAVPDKRRHDPITIGRDALNDVVVDHPTISRAHARLLPGVGFGKRWRVLDAGSRNGTSVGGTALPAGGQRELDDPVDVLTLGNVCLLFVDQDLFNLLACEAVSQEWAQGLPETKKVTEVSPIWRRLASDDDQTDPAMKA